MSGSVWYISVSKKKIEFKKYPKKKKIHQVVNKKSSKIKSLIINILFFSAIILFSSIISAAEINDTFHINVQTTFSNGSIQSGTFAFAFNITENSSASCLGPIAYNHSTSQTTDSRGIVSIYLPTIGSGGGNLSSLSFDKQYYLCYYRDGTLKDVSQLGRVPYSFRATQVNLSEVSIDSNLTLGSFNVSGTAGFFTFLGSLVNRITTLFVQDINASGAVNVSGIISAGEFSGPLNWTFLQNYPTGCGAGEAVQVIGDTLTCINISSSGGTITGSGTAGYIPVWNGTTSINNSNIYQNGSNIGINTTTPQNLLNVLGDANITGLIYGNGSQLTNVNADLLDARDSTFFMPLNTSVIGNFSFNGGWENGGFSIISGDIYAQTGFFYNITSLNVTRQNLTVNDDLLVFGNTDLRKNLTVDTNTLFVNSNTDRIGINTTTPQNLLNVLGNANITGTLYTNTISTIGDASDILSLQPASGLVTITGSSGTAAFRPSSSSTALYLGSSGGNTIYILSDRRVSIGASSSPQAQLLIQNLGTLNTYPTLVAKGASGQATNVLELQNSAGAQLFVVNVSSGFVGINTTTPQNLLNVRGDANITGLLTFGSLSSGVINSTHILDYTIGATDIAASAINTTHILDNTITAVDIGSSAINTTHILDNTILTDDIANGTITTADFVSDLNLGWANLTNYPTGCSAGEAVQVIGDTLTCVNISSGGGTITGSGTAGYIAVWNGTTSINNSNIYQNGSNIGINTTIPGTAALNISGLIFGSNGLTISAGTVSLPAGEIGASEIATSSINTTHILDATILAGDIAASAINTTHILDSTILTGDIAEGTILAGDIAPSAINTTHILDYTIGATDISASAINNTHILDGTILEGDIAQTSSLDNTEIEDIYLFNTGDTATGNYTFDSGTLFIDSSSDRVGIGTTNPTNGHLEIEDTGETNMLYLNADDNVPFALRINNKIANKNFGFYVEDTGELRLVQPGVINPIIVFQNETGNVGIATTGPSSKLEVTGDIELTNLLDNDASNFFDGGCTANQYISGIDSTGAITCAADTGTGTMSSFILGASAGTNQTITDGNTAFLVAGTGITTTAAATDIVTIAATLGTTIEGSEITDATITAADIAASAINTTHILDSTILTGDIAEGTILAGDIAPSAINTTHILDSTILSGDIAEGTILAGDLAPSSVNTTHIVIDTILAGDIATGAVATAEILDGTILDDDIAASQINTTHILDSTILTGDIAEGTILAGDIAPSAINNTHVLDNTLDFVDFAADLDLDESTNIDFGASTFNFILDLETGTGDFIIQDAGTMFAQFYDSGDVQLGNGNELYVNTSANAVGIGTTTPTGGILNLVGGNLNMSGNNITDLFKVTFKTGGEVDPPYRVGDTVYATYAPFMVGVKEEVTGTIMLKSDYIIDFNKLEVGSDLWLFNKVTDFGENWENLQVILTPGFDGRVWYEKNPNAKTLTVHGTQAGEVSYRMTANGFTWGNRNNVAAGLNASNYPDMAERLKK